MEINTNKKSLTLITVYPEKGKNMIWVTTSFETLGRNGMLCVAHWLPSTS